MRPIVLGILQREINDLNFYIKNTGRIYEIKEFSLFFMRVKHMITIEKGISGDEKWGTKIITYINKGELENALFLISMLITLGLDLEKEQIKEFAESFEFLHTLLEEALEKANKTSTVLLTQEF